MGANSIVGDVLNTPPTPSMADSFCELVRIRLHTPLSMVLELKFGVAPRKFRGASTQVRQRSKDIR